MARTIIAALALSSTLGLALAAEGFEDGLTAYRAEDYETAKRIWLPLAEAGDAETQFFIGLMQLKGQAFPTSEAEAVAWFRRAAEQGHARAQNNLGSYLLMGRGVAVDLVESAQWFRRSAEQGNAFAQNNIGRMYLEGEGVERDLVEAYVWLNLAAAKGVQKAQELLGELTPRLEPAEIREGERRVIAIRKAEIMEKKRAAVAEGDEPGP